MTERCEHCGREAEIQICPECDARVCEPCMESVPEGCPFCWPALSGEGDPPAGKKAKKEETP